MTPQPAPGRPRRSGAAGAGSACQFGLPPENGQGQFDARSDIQLLEHLPEMIIDRVRREILASSAVEQACRVVVGRPAGEDRGPLIGQQEPDLGTVQIVPHLVENRSGCPAEPATVIYVTVVGHLELFGSQPRAGTTRPGGDDFVAQQTSLATRSF